jgi:predicted nucleotidyltransferase
MGLDELINRHRDAVYVLAAKYGVSNIRAFGSVARRTADEHSDIDFLVDILPGTSLFDLGGFLSDLRKLLNCNVDVVTAKGLKPRIRQRVLNEAIQI